MRNFITTIVFILVASSAVAEDYGYTASSPRPGHRNTTSESSAAVANASKPEELGKLSPAAGESKEKASHVKSDKQERKHHKTTTQQ